MVALIVSEWEDISICKFFSTSTHGLAVSIATTAMIFAGAHFAICHMMHDTFDCCADDMKLL